MDVQRVGFDITDTYTSLLTFRRPSVMAKEPDGYLNHMKRIKRITAEMCTATIVRRCDEKQHWIRGNIRGNRRNSWTGHFGGRTDGRTEETKCSIQTLLPGQRQEGDAFSVMKSPLVTHLAWFRGETRFYLSNERRSLDVQEDGNGQRKHGVLENETR